MNEFLQSPDLPDSSPAGQEAQEKAREKFREQRSSQQAAATQAKKDESSALTHDWQISDFLTKLLKTQRDDDLIDLVIDLLEQNVPSAFITAILSLAYKGNVKEEVLNVNYDLELLIPTSQKEEQEIQKWVNKIINIALSDAERVYENMISASDWQIHPQLIQLAAYILSIYSKQKKIDIDAHVIDSFSKNLLEKIKEILNEQLNI